MNKKRKVPIENIFYMLSYVWERADLFKDSYLDNNDDFRSNDIVASIFLKNIVSYLKIGLYREYQVINEEIKGIKGKVDFKNSINNLSFENSKAFCEYDDFQENNLINQIIKSTAYKVYNLDEINQDIKGQINNVLLRFNNVEMIDISDEMFNINFNKQNYYSYETIKICEIIKNMTMISEKAGKYKFFNCFEDDKKLAKLFEMFIFKFYKSHEKSTKMKASFQNQITWNVEGVEKKWLPRMELDILLQNKEEVVIIDTKYYENFYNSDSRYEQSSKKLISPNLYQMFAYINNYETDKRLKGILLYPKSYTGEKADFNYELNRISESKIEHSNMMIKTIDLEHNWRNIELDLINIVKN